jgi:hypothetical protein
LELRKGATTLSMTSLNIMTFSVMTFSKMTHCKKVSIVTLSKSDTKYIRHSA